MKIRLFGERPWKLWKLAWEKRHNKVAFTSYIGGFLLVLIGLPYIAINHVSGTLARSAFNPEIPLDQSIPYVPVLNLAYVSFYVYYVVIPLLAQTEMERKCAIVFSQRLFIITLPVFLMFLLLPVEVDLRSQVEGDDVFTSILLILHGVDQPYNAWPSLHIAHSLCVVLATPLVFKLRRTPVICLWIAWLLLTISTMTSQQHYIFDVGTGAIYGLIAHFGFIKPTIMRCKSKELDDAFEQFQANNVETTSG